MVDSDRRDAYLKALRENNRGLLQGFVATKLAALDGLAETELAELVAEGLVIEQETYNGEESPILSRKVENPRASPLFKMFDLLGVNAREQLATPKSASEAKKDDALSSAGSLLERLLDFRRGEKSASQEIE